MSEEMRLVLAITALVLAIIAVAVSIGFPIFNYIHTNRLYKKTLENQKYVEEQKRKIP